jgi:hypothetical protein
MWLDAETDNDFSTYACVDDEHAKHGISSMDVWQMPLTSKPGHN